jgi:2-polyprenyl-6-methoxyphenol hydroxylase-like FAD-dependent oxidoreductase
VTEETGSSQVVIIGAGPAGLMLAAELCLAGVTPVVLERLPEVSDIPKGNGLVGQIVPVLDYRGLLEPLRAGSTYAGPVPGYGFGPLQLDFSRLGESPLHILATPQRRLEERLAGHLTALGASIRRGHEVTSLTRCDDHVRLDVRGPGGGYQLRAGYVVGCDGARSLVRKQAGIGFPGVTSTDVSRIGRVRLPAEMIVRGSGAVDVPGVGRLQPMAMTRTDRGRYSLGPLAALDKDAPRDVYIVATIEDNAAADLDTPMTLEELADSVRRVLGAELPMSDPLWLTRTIGNSRIAERYRDGRVLLAGDAAHLFGIGGQLSAGMLDAINLGWKLAAEIRGEAPDHLLDSYHAERHAAAELTQLHSRAQKALSAGGPYADALRTLVGDLLSFPDTVRLVGEMIEGSAVRYEVARGPAHPLAGRLAPDLRVRTADGRTRIAELMRAGRPLLLDFTPAGKVAQAAADWAGPVTILTGQPVITPTPAQALLIRPDAIVAWASADGSAGGLDEALRTWVPRADTGPAQVGSGFGSAPPYRRSRLAKISQACHRCRRSKSGNSVSRNTNSA